MKKFGLFLSLLLIICVLFTEVSFAEEEIGFVKTQWRKFLSKFKKTVAEFTPTQKEEVAPARKEIPPVTPEVQVEGIKETEELCKRIKIIVETECEVLDYIPELKVTYDQKGQLMIIEYYVNGIFKDIKELDKETLRKVYNRVQIERLRIITERRTRELERIRQMQIPNVPSPPKVFTAPTVPSTPPTPQAPPKVPSVPAVPKR